MTRKACPVQRGYVELERDGERFIGSYTVERGIITVRFGKACRTTQLGDSAPEILARLLLHELVLYRHLEGNR